MISNTLRNIDPLKKNPVLADEIESIKMMYMKTESILNNLISQGYSRKIESSNLDSNVINCDAIEFPKNPYETQLSKSLNSRKFLKKAKLLPTKILNHSSFFNDNKGIIYNVTNAYIYLIYDDKNFLYFLSNGDTNEISNNLILNILIGFQSSIIFLKKILVITSCIISNENIYRNYYDNIVQYGGILTYCLMKRNKIDYDLLGSIMKYDGYNQLLSYFNKVNGSLFQNFVIDYSGIEGERKFTSNLLDVYIIHECDQKTTGLLDKILIQTIMNCNIRDSLKYFLNNITSHDECRNQNHKVFIQNKWYNSLLVFELANCTTGDLKLEVNIDLSDLVRDNHNKAISYEFELISIIISPEKDKYLNFSKSIYDSKWRKFNDANPVDFNTINGKLFMLIYQKS